jgi:hypothetical protein
LNNKTTGKNTSRLALAMLVILGAACSQESAPVSSEAGETGETGDSVNVAALEARVAQLREKADRIRSGNDIKRLQRAFGYYFDEGLWDEMTALFSDDATIEYARDGVYFGKERIREYFHAMGNGQSGLQEGELNEHFQLMPVITLSEDGNSAKGRWRDIILKGQYGEWAWWGEGPYENEYVRENGVWKISKLHWFQTIMVTYEEGWGLSDDVNNGIYVSDILPPDAPMTIEYEPWPQTFLPPFSFENPVATYVPETATSQESGEGAQ